MMQEVEPGIFLCEVCKTTKASAMAAPVMMVRSGLSGPLFKGGYMLLLLATMLFTAFPQLEVSLTWTMLFCFYLVYFGLAFANFRRALYVG